MDGYFEDLFLGGDFATGLAADPIAKGTGHQTTFEFVSSTTSPMTLTLTNLTAVSSSTGSLSGSGTSFTYTPSAMGTQLIVLQATTLDANGTAALTLVTPNSDYPDDPDPLTIKRYDKYVSGVLTQINNLPLGTGQSTTFYFNYSARDLLPVTITATGVDIYSADGSTKLSDSSGQYTYTPASQGNQTFTIKAKTNFQNAGTISLSVDNMTNPTPLTVKQATTFTIPKDALRLADATSFTAPIYWRTNKTNSTSGIVGSASYFTADNSGNGSNTGNVTIDISSFAKADNTPVHFLYTYTERILLIVPVTRYMYATATLGNLINATSSSPVTLTFARN